MPVPGPQKQGSVKCSIKFATDDKGGQLPSRVQVHFVVLSFDVSSEGLA
jgi:hypothetical protein